MSPLLALFVCLGGAAVLIRVGVAVHRVTRMGRQRRADRRSERDVKAFVQGRMRNGGSSSRELPPPPWVRDTYPDVSAQIETIHPRRPAQ